MTPLYRRLFHRFARNQKGQSTLEFVLSFGMVMAFVLFYFQLSLVFAYGSFVQYATYMSSRTLLSSASTIEEQEVKACEVMTSYLGKNTGCGISAGQERFSFFGKGDPVSSDMGITGFAVKPPTDGKPFSPTNSGVSWQQGVRYTFRSRLFLIPLTGLWKGSEDKSEVGQDGLPLTEVRLTSESWLSREPTVQECTAEMQRLNGKIDNGC